MVYQDARYDKSGARRSWQEKVKFMDERLSVGIDAIDYGLTMEFFDTLQVCTIQNICDEESALNLFSYDACYLLNVYFPFVIERVRKDKLHAYGLRYFAKRYIDDKGASCFAEQQLPDDIRL